MKVGIITVHKANNYGAFLQAFALQSYLQERGHQVWFIKHHVTKLFLYMCKEAVLSILQGRFLRIPFLIIQEGKMRQARKVLREKSKKQIADLDVVILGSDEIWNVRRKKICRYPILFGWGIPHHNKISYAPSVNSASIEDFGRNPKLVNALNELKTISVRDEHSKSIVAHITGKNVQVVLDPTALMSKEFYREHMKPVSVEKPFVLVYSYGRDMNDKDIITELIQYAHNRNLVLISVVGYLEWCDYNIGGSPFEVLAYFDAAEFVITDTFHGTMLSVIFEKDFIVTSVTSRKLEEVLRLFNVKERVISACDEISKVISTHINYDLVNRILYKKVQESKDFLDAALIE